MIELSCHCAKIKITVPDTTDTVTSCNCSICSRYASLWAYFNPKDINVIANKEDLGAYCYGDKTIIFYHCKNCACITHYMPTDRGNKHRMAVNFRLTTPETLNTVKVRYFDGADSWQFINE
ncbi:aldehyde-activating protein [Pseudoalteromonas denitrificans]|uniref:Uncharacterized conserved protein n=1 Tax=Pseudoalteromonas denitrificans DSM 6059 TaxID=1123010 RepID=A0A1I1N568_9GAMM|nr:aldehyde-activating protein [Pseudoalteromonas denitrificans]SFC92807.1 Uncharacterized conserved protein [Pseudoalteromonas denitrificans DSM 6059]